MITYQRERVIDIREECLPLFEEHWKEIGLFDKEKIKLDPDWELYELADLKGMLFVLTCREDSVLIGYYVSFINPHHHYKGVLYSQCDIIFLKKDKRKGSIGYRMITEAEKALKDMGIGLITFSIKAQSNLHKIAKRLNYKPLDMVYFKET